MSYALRMNGYCKIIGIAVFVAQAATLIEVAFGQNVESEHSVDALSKDVILRAWAERLRKINDVEIVWKESTLTRKGSLPGFGKAGPFPREDLIETHQSEVWLSGGAKLRYVRSGQLWNGERCEFGDGKYMSTFDGVVSESGFSGPAYTKVDSGYVGSHFQDIDNPRLWAPILMYRPSVTEIGGLTIDEWELKPDSREVESRACAVLQKKISPTRIRTVYLDIGLEYLPVLIVDNVADKPFLQFNIRYETDPEVGPVPISWKCIELSTTGSTRSEFEAVVEKRTFNQQTGVPAFRIDYQPGTVVQDYRDNKIIVLGRDGSKASYSRKDWEDGKLPANALSVDPNEKNGPWTARSIFVFANVVIVILLLIILVRRRNIPKAVP